MGSFALGSQMVEELDNLVFMAPLCLELRVWDDEVWRVTLGDLGGAAGASAADCVEQLVRALSAEVRELVPIPVTQLTREAAARKGLLLARIDVLNSDGVGIDHPMERHILGEVRGREFFPCSSDHPVMPLGASVPDVQGLYFACVKVDRSGWPEGEVLSLSPRTWAQS